jgi:AraC-like DNA-binding protein
LLAKSAANLGPPRLSKIGPGFPKERRVLSRHLDSSSPEQEMKTNGSHTNGVEPIRIRKARHFIHEHCGEQISLGHVAKAVSTSPNYLSEKFKEATGINFVSYVARVRYEKAAGLLRESDLRISEIAFATGFQSLSQFNRTFRKLAGKSPTDFRAAADCRARNGS